MNRYLVVMEKSIRLVRASNSAIALDIAGGVEHVPAGSMVFPMPEVENQTVSCELIVESDLR